MNLQEFAALKPGDKITNPANGNNTGEVTAATPSGVHVVWGPRSDREKPFYYSVQTTAWMSWNVGAAE